MRSNFDRSGAIIILFRPLLDFVVLRSSTELEKVSPVESNKETTSKAEKVRNNLENPSSMSNLG